jgi:hypothetical protein
MKLNDLIIALEALKRKKGNLNVLVSADPEGNCYGDFGDALEFDVMNQTLLLFPEGKVWADELERATR